MQNVECSGQLLILALIHGHIGLRAALFIIAIFQMAFQRGFTLGVITALELIRHVLQNLHIGFNALGLNRATRGRIITCSCQTQSAIVLAERQNGLHRAFPKGACAQNGGALMILQSTVNDF